MRLRFHVGRSNAVCASSVGIHSKVVSSSNVKSVQLSWSMAYCLDREDDAVLFAVEDHSAT